MQEYFLKTLAEDSGKRLDVFLADFSKNHKLGLSREFIKKLILGNCVNSPGINTSLKSHYKIKTGDEFRIFIKEREKNNLAPENIPLEILYEDKDLALINKPIGLVVHPAPGNYEHTLVSALLFHFKKLSDINPQRPGIVHRLDKDTSGVMVVAKNNDAHLALVKQFSEHTIKRKYIALVRGKIEFDEGVIELPIARHPFKRKNMAVSFNQNSKYAKTFYRTIKRGKNLSLLELEPFTGRTHQLRVHLAHLGHPILGDVKYGKNNEFKRLALHAFYLGFSHPRTKKFVEFTSQVPLEFKEVINEV